MKCHSFKIDGEEEPFCRPECDCWRLPETVPFNGPGDKTVQKGEITPEGRVRPLQEKSPRFSGDEPKRQWIEVELRPKSFGSKVQVIR